MVEKTHLLGVGVVNNRRTMVEGGGIEGKNETEIWSLKSTTPKLNGKINKNKGVPSEGVDQNKRFCQLGGTRLCVSVIYVFCAGRPVAVQSLFSFLPKNTILARSKLKFRCECCH